MLSRMSGGRFDSSVRIWRRPLPLGFSVRRVHALATVAWGAIYRWYGPTCLHLRS